MQAASISNNHTLIFFMISQDSKIKFPLWQYLNQPVFSSTTKLILNPRHFGYFYRVETLERCFAIEYDSQGRHCN